MGSGRPRLRPFMLLCLQRFAPHSGTITHRRVYAARGSAVCANAAVLCQRTVLPFAEKVDSPSSRIESGAFSCLPPFGRRGMQRGVAGFPRGRGAHERGWGPEGGIRGGGV